MAIVKKKCKCGKEFEAHHLVKKCEECREKDKVNKDRAQEDAAKRLQMQQCPECKATGWATHHRQKLCPSCKEKATATA